MMRYLAFVPLLVLPLASPAAATELVGWDVLVDQASQNYEDPYVDLSYEQLEDVRTVALESLTLEQGGLSREERTARALKRDTAQARLSGAGIDADWLISQRWVVADRREKAATAANTDLDGEIVTLGGFAIPAPPDADGTPIAYLVPLPGMCSHMPPPNPNQMVRIRLNTGWTPERLHQPIRVTGRLAIEPTDHVFHVVDGPVQMRASLAMDAEKVRAFGSFSSRTPSARGFHQAPPTSESADE